jgi:hypothetical protein
MAREANDCGLLLDFVIADLYAVDPFDTLHDEVTDNAGWTLAGVGRREIPPKNIYHASVSRRIANAACDYAPNLSGGATFVETKPSVTLPDGTKKTYAPPSKTHRRAPVRPSLSAGHYAWFAISLAATCVLFALHHPDGFRLAQAQLGALVSGDFCAALNAEGFPPRSLDHLLPWDTAAIVAYGSLLPILGLMLFRASDRGGAVPAWLGRWFQWSAIALPAFDLLENFLSERLLAHVGVLSADRCGETISRIGSHVLGAASAGKCVALGALFLLIVTCVARALVRTVRA